MAHFAKINDNNVVLAVLAIDDKDCQNDNGVETESVGQAYLQTHNNWPSDKWIQTSYNTYKNQHQNNGTAFRGNYASKGYIWDASNDIFWPPKPFASWTKNTTTADWEAPLAKPDLTDTQENQNTANTHEWAYEWDEDDYQADNTTGWNLVDYMA